MNKIKKIKILAVSILLISPLIAHGDNYYDILGVSPNSSQGEIRKAFKTLAQKYHPDRNHHSNHNYHPDAEERFKQINEAHETLKDPTKRQQYDRSLLLSQQGQIPNFLRTSYTGNPFAHIEEIMRAVTGDQSKITFLPI